MSAVSVAVFIMCVIIHRSPALPTSIQGMQASQTERFRMTTAGNSTVQVVISAVRVRKNDEDNLRSGQCPNGEVFTLACNRCGCNIDTGVTLCSASLCIGWRCPRQQRHECYGRCPCNENTFITSCERKTCFTSGDAITRAQQP